jgi:hypothetical protein
MASNLAPGVEIIERSFSQRIEPISNTEFATLGMFAKGPVNERRRISSVDELIEVFGRPDDTTYQYFFPIAKILDEAPVYIVRVEEGTKLCSGLTVGISGGDTTSFDSPVEVDSYPLTYDSIFTDHDKDTDIQVEIPAGMTDTITFAAVGPGTQYNNIEVAVINREDYGRLVDFQTSLAESITPDEITAIGETAYNLALSGQGMPLALAEELIDPDNSYDVDTSLLDNYVAFENGPASDDEFGIYEFESGTFVRAYLVSTDPDKKDRFASSMFANRVLANGSENLRVFVNTTRLSADGTEVSTIAKTSLAGASTLSTSATSLTDEFFEQLNLNYFSKEDVGFAAFVDLDFPVAIKQRMDEICNVRKDAIALLNVAGSTMINLNTGQKTENQTGLVKAWKEDTLKINSSYSSIYANYFKIYDQYNDEERWVPCTGHVANRMAFTFNNFEPWYAVAGLERGLVSGVLKVAYNPTDAQRKVIYPRGINPVVEFRGEGVVIWGQKTLQSIASATDRLNVRELLIYIGTNLEVFSRTILFKQNDEFTRAEWRAQVGPFLNSILQRRGIEDYRVVCDETNNTPDVVARNEFQGYVIVRPTTVAEFVKIVIADVGGGLTIDEVLTGIKI